MTKRSSFLFAIFLFSILSVQISIAQQSVNYSLAGKLLDRESKQPVEFASVAIYKMSDTSLVTGIITNAKGEFLLKNLPSGKYVIKSSFVGYQTNSMTIQIAGAPVNLSEPIYLSTSAMSLNEVQVTASRNEKQISVEKTKINVSQNISAVSGNVTEVLKSQSAVTIDGGNNIYLRGNKNILILIDGVPTTLSSLNSIPTSNVENIEIITNPDVKYDAEGTGGIINIVTKRKNMSGVSGAFSLNYGVEERVNGGAALNYSKGIWDIGINYNGKYERADVKSALTRELYSDNVLVEQNVKSIQTNKTHTLAFLINSKPTKKDLFSLGFKYMSPDMNNNQVISGRQIKAELPEVIFNRKNDVTFSRKIIESSLSYKKIFEKGKNEISLDASFSKTKGSRPAEYYIEDELLQKSSGGGTPTNMTIQADYLKSVFKTGIVEVGLKGFSRWNNFNYYFYDLDETTLKWNLNPAFSNDLEHKEYIYSSYLMYSDTLFSNTFFKIGARVEYNTSEFIQISNNDRISRNYVFPFPYLLVKRNIDKSRSIALSVNRRITRPTYPQLNPFIYVIDQMTYETGNKQLEPEVLDKIEFNYSMIKERYQLRTNLYFSMTENFISQVSMLSVPDKLILTYVNGDEQKKIGGDLDITYKFNNYITVNPAFSLFYNKSKGFYNEIDLSTDNLAWTGNVKTTIKPEKQTEIQLLLSYSSPIDLPQFRLNSIYYADVAVKRAFYGNRFSVSLTMSDIFNTRNWDISSDNLVYKLNNHSKSQTRTLWIGLTYNFNSFKSGKFKNGENENDGSVIKF
ncbi:MAG: outer membrane beta-barrel protein [Rikenellaceae bacterium]|nr:outer membrane beta-barrel protein [Rikenellaceae bacterium]